MEMLISIIAAFVVEVIIFTYVGGRIFRPLPAHQFVSLRAHREYNAKQEMQCRESHILEAVVVGLTGGLIACYFMGIYFLPVLGAMVTLESVWLVMTHEFRPHLRQNYVIKSNLFAGTGAALAIGIITSILAAASVWPIIIALVLFWIAWIVLMPM